MNSRNVVPCPPRNEKQKNTNFYVQLSAVAASTHSCELYLLSRSLRVIESQELSLDTRAAFKAVYVQQYNDTLIHDRPSRALLIHKIGNARPGTQTHQATDGPAGSAEGHKVAATARVVMGQRGW